MKTLVIQHEDIVGPGSLGSFLAARGERPVVARLDLGDPLPDDPAFFRRIISLGGTMSANDHAGFPWLTGEADFLARAVAAGVPILGLCLGGQILAQALGAEVAPVPVPEKGWRTIALTPAGAADPLFADLPDRLEVFHWHQDGFSLPDGAVLLASGQEWSHQAFRKGSGWGLQFHPEIVQSTIVDWADTPDQARELLARHAVAGKLATEQADRIYTNFWAVGGPGAHQGGEA